MDEPTEHTQYTEPTEPTEPTQYTRTHPARVADERTSLTGFLDYQRQTLAMKCHGLSEGQLREKAVPPSSLSLLGLVWHLAGVERSWFQKVINAEHAGDWWRGGAGEFVRFDVDVDEAGPDEAFDAWHAECARSRAVVDAAESLDKVGHHGGEEFSLRYVLLHMIEEYARHNGHADLLRERLDGATGE